MKKIWMLITMLFGISVCEQVDIGANDKVIDVRTKEEYDSGHLKNAINIPVDIIKEKISAVVKNKEEKIIVYCRSGRRSGIAQKTLINMGYKNVINAGGYDALKKKEDEKLKK